MTSSSVERTATSRPSGRAPARNALSRQGEHLPRIQVTGFRFFRELGHAKGKTITPDTALAGVGVPLHAGAERFYREVGLVK